MPLAYSFDKEDQHAEPCVTTKCDLSSCSGSGAFQRLQCFHTFHTVCLNENHQCPICSPHLKAHIKTLADSFNTSLLEPTKSKTSASSDEQPEEENPRNVMPNQHSIISQPNG